MLKGTVITLWLCCIAATAFSQLVPNQSLEQWQTSGSQLYEEPAGGFWATLNPLRDLGGPVTVEKVTDACDGTYAAKLTSKFFTSLLVSGLLTSGSFNQSNLLSPLQFGKPFTMQVENFSGCFKFSPVAGDSCALVAWLSKWNPNLNQRDTIAVASVIVDTAVSQYTSFSLPMVYQSSNAPDTLTIILSSSAGGQNNAGQEGTALWVDNLGISITDGLNLPLMPEVQVKAYPNPFTGQFTVDYDDVVPGTITLISLEGKKVLEKPLEQGLTTLQVANLPVGTYTYLVSQKGKTVNWGKLTKN